MHSDCFLITQTHSLWKNLKNIDITENTSSESMINIGTSACCLNFTDQRQSASDMCNGKAFNVLFERDKHVLFPSLISSAVTQMVLLAGDR